MSGESEKTLRDTFDEAKVNYIQYGIFVQPYHYLPACRTMFVVYR